MAFIGQDGKVFDEDWRVRATHPPVDDSWVGELVALMDAGGKRYLATLGSWFERFPFSSPKHRRAMKTRLESFVTSEHLGAVNELSWNEFMRKHGFHATPISPTTTPRPDFRITAPIDVFVEVSTLNVSEAQKNALNAIGGVDLDHNETLRRLLRKASEEKVAQLQFSANQTLPCLLVLFDYTLESGLPKDFYRFLATELLNRDAAFSRLPSALSGIIYVKRQVFDGHIRLSSHRSAIYYNPEARYPLTPGTFDMMWEFGRDIWERKPRSNKDWIEL